MTHDDKRSKREQRTEVNTGVPEANRRQFLAMTGATAGAIALGSGSVSAEYQPVTDVPGFACDHPHFTCGREVSAASGMVSTVDPIAGGVAARVLREGGNAIDASIALQYALNVTQPHGSGIGGGGFMVIYDAESESVEIVNSRERASRRASPDLFYDADAGEYSQSIEIGEAMGVPGTVEGLETARERFGSRSRNRLISPAIRLARNGFTVDTMLAEQIAGNVEKFNEAAIEVFSDDSGEFYEAGDRMTNPDLADTLDRIRRHGSEGFYHGPVAEDLAETIQSYARDPDQAVDLDDLAKYYVTHEEPVRKEWYDVELVGQPLPSSGPSVLSMILRMLEFLDIETYDLRSPEMYHLIAETIYTAWGDRMEYMGDPEFVDVPVDGLLSDAYLESRIADIEMGQTVFPEEGSMGPGDPYSDVSTMLGSARPFNDGGQTTHFSVVDQYGNAVSYTSTIEQFMGSGKVVPGRGFLINNELTDFDAEPGGANAPAGWKRPLSSMSPMIVLRDGRPEFTAGSPGGWAIITSTMQAILFRYAYGLGPLESITEPSIYTHSFGGVSWDDGVPEDARETLAEWGHDVDDEPSMLGNVQVIDIGDDVLTGAADPNRDGQAVGYDRPSRDRGRAGQEQ